MTERGEKVFKKKKKEKKVGNKAKAEEQKEDGKGQGKGKDIRKLMTKCVVSNLLLQLVSKKVNVLTHALRIDLLPQFLLRISSSS